MDDTPPSTSDSERRIAQLQKGQVWYSNALEVLNPLRHHLGVLLEEAEAHNRWARAVKSPELSGRKIRGARTALEAADVFFAVPERTFRIGDYVLASHWSDQDPNDPWRVGFIVRILQDKRGITYIIGDEDGTAEDPREYRHVKRLTPEEGRAHVEAHGVCNLTQTES